MLMAKSSSTPLLLRPLSRAPPAGAPARTQQPWQHGQHERSAVLDRVCPPDLEAQESCQRRTLLKRASAARLETPTGKAAADLRWGGSVGPPSATAPLRRRRGSTNGRGRRARHCAPQQELQMLQQRIERSHENLCLANPDGIAKLVDNNAYGFRDKEAKENLSTMKAVMERALTVDQPAGDSTLDFFISGPGRGFVGRFRSMKARCAEEWWDVDTCNHLQDQQPDYD